MSWQKLKKAREDRGTTVIAMEAMLKKAEVEKRDLTADEVTQFDELHQKAATLLVDVKDAERRNVVAGFRNGGVASFLSSFGNVDNPQPATEWRDSAGRPVRVLSSLEQRVSDNYETSTLSLGRAIRAMVTGDWSQSQDEHRALSTGFTSGGYLIDAPMLAGVIDKARAKTVIFEAGAHTVVWDGSKTLDIARVTTDPAFQVKAENAAFTPNDPAFDRVTLNAFTIGSEVVASRELAADAPNFATAIEDAMASALAVKLDYLAMFGAGTTEPMGIANAAGVQSVAAVGALTNYSDFVNAWTKVLTANGEPNAYILAPRDAGTLEGILTTNGGYLLPPAGIAKLKRLITSSIATNGGAGANESNAFVGDFTKLIVGLRQNAMVEVTTTGGDTFDKHQAKIKITWRGDIALSQPTHFVNLLAITP